MLRPGAGAGAGAGAGLGAPAPHFLSGPGAPGADRALLSLGPSVSCRSIHIVALGNEGDSFHQDNRPSGLIRTYLGRSPLVSGDESSLLLSATSTVARPVFTEYQASAFGNVKLVVHDCPVWVRRRSGSRRRRTQLFFHFSLFPPPLPPPRLVFSSPGSPCTPCLLCV